MHLAGRRLPEFMRRQSVENLVAYHPRASDGSVCPDPVPKGRDDRPQLSHFTRGIQMAETSLRRCASGIRYTICPDVWDDQGRSSLPIPIGWGRAD